MTGETETEVTGESNTVAEVVVDTAATTETAPPADPRAVKNPGLPKPGKTVMVRRAGKPDAPGLITSVDGSGLVTASILPPNHHLVETVKNLAEIHPADRITGWYWPEE